MNRHHIYLIYLVLFCLGRSSTLFAQKDSLDITLPQKVEKMIQLKKALNKEQFNRQYYAIQLYYGSNTTANRILKAFKSKYATWETELIFETPNYKVRVGRFKDLNIANQKLEEIREEYPAAFLLEPNNL